MRTGMSIRPSDLQIIIQKTQDVERIQQIQQQHSRIQQQQFAQEMNKIHKNREKDVTQTPKPQEAEIREEERRKKGGEKKSEEEAYNEQGAHDEDEEEETGQNLDIKI
ncbi:MAG: hypothetical protein QMD53_03455 [Actinomycetota bacterium]|nr:hypothetical protein [Actinomycetota bacterium]